LPRRAIVGGLLRLAGEKDAPLVWFLGRPVRGGELKTALEAAIGHGPLPAPASIC
jgi:hypothetical protein